MSAPTRPSTLVQGRAGRFLGAAVALSLIGTSLVSALPAEADTSVTAQAGSFTLRGAGFGHGWGMSQYGAYGAARKGLKWEKIMAFYYPGTKLTKMSSNTVLKVWVTGDNDGSVRVLPARGLKVYASGGGSYTVPTGSTYKSWRISRSGSGYKLSYRKANGSYVTKSTGLSNNTWKFSNSARIVRVVMPNGAVRPYRGSVALVKRGSSGRTVNRVKLEN